MHGCPNLSETHFWTIGVSLLNENVLSPPHERGGEHLKQNSGRKFGSDDRKRHHTR